MSFIKPVEIIDTQTRKRRKRTIISSEQLHKLETSFKREQWPNKYRKEKLATELGSDEQFVSIWFQNKRARVKREEDMSKLGVGQFVTDATSVANMNTQSVDKPRTDSRSKFSIKKSLSAEIITSTKSMFDSSPTSERTPAAYCKAHARPASQPSNVSVCKTMHTG